MDGLLRRLRLRNPIDVISYLKYFNFHRRDLNNFFQWWKDVCFWISRILEQSFSHCLTEPIVRIIGFESLWKVHIFEQFTSRVNVALNCTILFHRKINRRCAWASKTKNGANPRTKDRQMKSISYIKIHSSIFPPCERQVNGRSGLLCIRKNMKRILRMHNVCLCLCIHFRGLPKNPAICKIIHLNRLSSWSALNWHGKWKNDPNIGSFNFNGT